MVEMKQYYFWAKTLEKHIATCSYAKTIELPASLTIDEAAERIKDMIRNSNLDYDNVDHFGGDEVLEFQEFEITEEDPTIEIHPSHSIEKIEEKKRFPKRQMRDLSAVSLQTGR